MGCADYRYGKEMTIVSNSDIEAAQKCERMFLYSRLMGLRPRILPVFIRRGSFGHEMMESGFSTLLSGGTVDEAVEAAAVPLTKLLESDDPDKPELMKVYRHVSAFIIFSQSDQVQWRPVALEDKSMWPIDEDLVFGFTPDLVVEFQSGLYKGQHAVLDYKFLAQYTSDITIKMSQQIPKYIMYRNEMNGSNIHRGAYAMFNTRASATDTGYKLFKISWVEPSKTRLERIRYENHVLSERVALMHETPIEIAKQTFVRTVNKDVCDRCWFVNICDKEFEGKDITKDIERDYVLNDYGYNIIK